MPYVSAADHAARCWLEHGGSDLTKFLAILSVGLGTDEAGTPLADLVDASLQLLSVQPNPYEVAARKQGWRILPDTVNYTTVPGELSIMQQDQADSDSCYEPSAAGWKLACEENGIEPIVAVVEERLLVDAWLAGELEKKGELVTDVAGLHIWSRARGDVRPWADPVIEAIAAEQATSADPSPEPY